MSSRATPFLVFLFALVLVSCTSLHEWALGNPDAQDKGNPEVRDKGGPASPNPGDTKVVKGVEFIYAQNIRYMSDPYQPEYVWLKKDEYLQSPFDAMRERAAAERKERDELRRRLAKLENEVNGGGPGGGAEAQAPAGNRQGQAAAGRRWEVYASSANGVNYFIDRGSITSSGGLTYLWRKRTFPDRAFQKEIISRDEVDCRRGRYRSLEVQGVYWDGRNEASRNVSPWIKFYDDTTEDIIFVDTCKEAGKRS